MNDYNLTRIVSPKRDDGEPDLRYARLVKNALADLSPSVVKGLADGYENLVNHKNSTFPYVQKLLIQVLNEADKHDEWLQQGMRKQLREVAAVFGYSAFDTSKMIGAVELEHKLVSGNNQAADWFKEQNLSVKYELSKMNDDGFTHVWAKLSKWGTEAVTQKQLKALVSEYPKAKQRFGGGRPSGSKSTYSPPTPAAEPSTVVNNNPVDTLVTLDSEVYDDIKSTNEAPKVSTNVELVSQLISTLNQLDLDALSVDTEAKTMLLPNAERLEILADLSRRVKDFKPTYV